jgi:glycosyltransferase involved in cell wall biosynthesis
MLNSLARQLDPNLYSPVCIGISDQKVFVLDPATIPYRLIQTGTSDIRALQQLILNVIDNVKPSVVAIIGLDVWDLAPIYDSLATIKRRDQFTTVGIMPYDLMFYREDWAAWFNFFDIPCVYSQYGFDMLKDNVPNLRYFRPELDGHELFKPNNEARAHARALWSVANESTYVFGFVGPNQIRKDPLRLIKAFSIFKKSTGSDIALYMHMDMDRGVYSFQSYAEDCGLKMGDIITKTQGRKYTPPEMVGVFNGIDCLVNCTLQEGLSWTPIEAMLCGTPVIASDSTAHTELLKDVGILIPPTEMAFVPVFTKHGAGWVESKACSVYSMVEAMVKMYEEPEFSLRCSEAGLKAAQQWIAGVSDFNELITDAVQSAKPVHSAFPKRRAVLFAQQGSAGDVLMTTSILEQIKARHPGKELVYMTQRQFVDIVEGNPNIDEVIFWDESKLSGFEIAYNPHGEKILTGRWNTLDMMLHKMYAHFTKTETGKSVIYPVKPNVDLPDKFVIFHTTGAAYTRIYKNWDFITKGVKELGYDVVQLGSLTDWPVKDSLDLRGELTFRESAYVMQRAKGAVTVDSFVSHLAGCMDIPQVCLFGPAPARVTRPFADADKLICIEPDRYEVCPICGACYGEFKCQSPCINTISPFVILDELKKLLRKD